MLLADGGTITLTARSDRFTAAKWADLLDSRDLAALRPSDFEMVDGGERIPLTYDCVRNP
jgi:serine/threonine-protein kinase